MLNGLINKTGTLSAYLLPLLLMAALGGCASAPETAPEAPAAKADPAALNQFNNAISELKSGNTQQARKMLQQLATSHPDLAGVHVNLGILYLKDNALDKAETSFNAALKLNPNNISALNHLGIVHRQNGKFEDAKNLYEKAINIDPNYAYAHLNLGILYDLYLYDLSKALLHYKKYQELHKDDEKIEKWIVDLERRQKKTPLAAQR